MQELNLTVNQGLVLLIMLAPLAIWGLKHLGTVTIEKPEPKEQETQLSPQYGRYVQLRGVYHD